MARWATVLVGIPLAAAVPDVVVVSPTARPEAVSLAALSRASGGRATRAARTLAEAQRLARQLTASSDGTVDVLLLPGEHELAAPLELGAADGRVAWRGLPSEAGGAPVVSGGRAVEGWRPCGGGGPAALLCADVTVSIGPELAQPRQLFVNGRRAPRSRAPASVVAAFAKPLAVDDDRYVVGAQEVGAWGGGDAANVGAVELLYTAEGSPWTESRCTVENVTKVTEGYAVFMKQPCFAIVRHKPCGQSTSTPAFIENTGVHDLLPGQWTLDRSGGRVVVKYLPLAGEFADNLAAVMPVLERLVVGADASSPVSNHTFFGITFAYATWSRPNTGLGYVEQQSGALVSRPGTQCLDYEWLPMPGNIVFNGSRGITFSNCTFQHLGAAALQFTGGAQNNSVTRCAFRDVSGAAMQLGAYNTSAEKDLERQERFNTVEDSTILGVAAEFHGNAGLSVGYSFGTQLLHNEIGFVTYSGISIGWGWAREPDSYAGGNSVVGNHVHDFKLQLPAAALGDGGGIYALGPQRGSVMEGNWVTNMGSGRGGGGYYPDEGSAYWEIRRNVFSNATFCQDDCQWLHIWTQSIHDISTHDCFTDTATQDVHGTNTPVVNITVVTDGKWPQAALDIMRAAGPRPPTSEAPAAPMLVI